MTLRCYSELTKRGYVFEFKDLEGLIEVEIGFHDHKQNGHYYLLVRYQDSEEALVRFNSGVHFHGELESELIDLLKNEPSTVFYNGDYNRLQVCLNKLPKLTKVNEKESNSIKKLHKKYANYGTLARINGLER